MTKENIIDISKLLEEKNNSSEQTESNASSIPNQEKIKFHQEITKRIEALNKMSEEDTVQKIIGVIEKHCKGNGVEPYLKAIKDKVNWSIKELRRMCKQTKKPQLWISYLWLARFNLISNKSCK